MTGTLAGALEARGIPSNPDRLVADVEGTIENVEGRPLITRIKVHYTLKIPKGKRPEVERALALHDSRCPASQSVQRGIRVEWEGDIIEE
ncbi:MAG: OsmC family protein [Acidobacteria bacterium]|nr:OsmC family protein [Acidobacteriota bacterium]